jgi:hypothetical protein
MKPITKKLALPAGLGLLVSLGALCANLVCAQAPWPFAPPTTPMAQRNAMNLVLNQINWFQNATRSASSLYNNGYGLLTQQFQAVRDQYAGFKSTLNPQQLSSGANRLAELDAGLDIIQEAFTDYQTGVANGQSTYTALANMRRVLNKAIGVWAQEFKQDCRQLQVGW